MTLAMLTCSEGSKDRFDTSIKHQITVESIRGIIGQNTIDNIKTQSTCVWGFKEGPQNNKKWDKLKPGDNVIFVKDVNETLEIIAYGTISVKEENQVLAEKIWGRDKNETWKHVFFLKDVELVSLTVQKKELKKVDGTPYKEGRNQGAKLFDETNPNFHVLMSKLNSTDPTEIKDTTGIREGSVRKVYVNAYERNQTARRQCIETYGCCCYACGFNFGKIYGSEFNGMIQVHHKVPLNTIGEEYEVDAVKDLVPLCPNCHFAIHKILANHPELAGDSSVDHLIEITKTWKNNIRLFQDENIS